MSGHDLTADYDKPVTHADLAAVVTEPEQLRAENQQLREALEMIAASPCLPNILDGGCVGAVHSRRKRYDNPERTEVVGCPKHFAEAALARVEKSE